MMRQLFLFIGSLIYVLGIAQVNVEQIKNVKPARQWKVNLSEVPNVLEIAALKNDEAAPKPITDSDKVKQELDARRHRKMSPRHKGSYVQNKSDVAPIVDTAASFNGRPQGGSGVPNDNTMAISNDGIIVSAINTTVTVLDEQGNLLLYRSLRTIVGNQLGVLDRYYDPKVTYDPIEDRFILIFLEGSNSSDTRIVVGFTETNDPTGDWNFYALDGRPLGGTTWSDYPIIAHNKEDLYITVNLLNDGESWQEGFLQSFIWQVNKEDGYTGQQLTTNLFHTIEYDGKSVWSICPVQPALNFDQDNMYFLSVRPGAASNDTVFLHEVTNTAKSGLAEHKLTVLTTNTNYGVPPTVFQPTVGFRLQTNDTRVLSATVHNNKIHYVQSTLVPSQLSSGVYHGIISDVASNPSIDGEILSSETMDFAYPSLAFAGIDANDEHSMLITFSHVGESDFPGTSAIFHNKNEGSERLYSDVIMVKKGDDVIDAFVPDTAERWGDYTDIQRKYNEPGIVWLCGSYGDDNASNNVWIAKLKVENKLVKVDQLISYPNPANNSITVAARFDKAESVDIRLSDMRGKIVKQLQNQQAEIGVAKFMFSTTGFSSGSYVLSIVNNKGEVLHSQKIVIE